MRNLFFCITFLSLIFLILIKGTSSYFSDIETLDDNFGVAGQINLLIGNTTYKNSQIIPETTWNLKDQIVGNIFAFENLLSLDSGSNIISFSISDNPAWVCIQIDSNESSQFEEQIDIFIWADDGDGVYESNEQEIHNNTLDTIVQRPISIADSETNYFDQTNFSPLSPNSVYYLGLSWCVGDLTPLPRPQDNRSDQSNPSNQIFFDCTSNLSSTEVINTNLSLSFQAVQARNNHNFSCN